MSAKPFPGRARTNRPSFSGGGIVAAQTRLQSAGMQVSHVEHDRDMTRNVWVAETDRGRRWVVKTSQGQWQILKQDPAEAKADRDA